MTCDDYQIAFDQLEAGAPAALTRAEVDAHVATCTACTDYVALSRKLSASMSTTYAAAPIPLDAAAMRDRMLHEMRYERYRAPVLAALMPAGLFLGAVLGHASGASLAITVAVALGLGAAVYPVIKAVRARRFGKYHSELVALEAVDGGELVAGVRVKLGLKIRHTSQVLAMSGTAGALAIVNWLLATPQRRTGVQGALWIAVAVLSLVVVIQKCVDLRRTRRERAQLGD